MADDLDNRNRKKLNEMDEIEQEERERKMRKSLDSKFSAFVRKIEEQALSNRTKLEFDIPFDDLYFHGAPMRASVKIMPTKNCLVALSEFPCFVLDVSDIEIVHFERIHFNLKNFDLAIIYKDYTTFKRICSIPIEHLEDIKNYLDSIGVIFSQSVQPINWKNILDDIREDFNKFIADGGWKQMAEEDDEEVGDEGEDSAEEDSNFSGAVDGAESSEEDYSEEDESFASDEESDVSSLDESAVSWDELDRRAEQEERKNAAKRVGRDTTDSKKRHR
jgi:nucleosome binding factor SPN SPT16 subunit